MEDWFKGAKHRQGDQWGSCCDKEHGLYMNEKTGLILKGLVNRMKWIGCKGWGRRGLEWSKQRSEDGTEVIDWYFTKMISCRIVQRRSEFTFGQAKLKKREDSAGDSATNIWKQLSRWECSMLCGVRRRGLERLTHPKGRGREKDVFVV